MKKEELRIGNWVDSVYNIPYIKITEIKNSIVCGINCKGMSYSSLKPIPLSEDVLLKCGFDNKDNILFRNEHIDLIFNCDAEYIWIYDKQLKDCICVKCKNLHQLQNIYYALTGEELEVSL